MSMMEGYLLITTTIDDGRKAEELASLLVERRLAACTQILGPIRSIYRWKGSIQKDEEYLLLIKSRKEHFQDIEELFKTEHPYEVPELVGWKLEVGSEGYLGWMSESLLP